MRTPEQVIGVPVEFKERAYEAAKTLTKLLPNVGDEQQTPLITAALYTLVQSAYRAGVSSGLTREGLVINKAVTREEIAKLVEPLAFTMERGRRHFEMSGPFRNRALETADAILALISAGGGK